MLAFVRIAFAGLIFAGSSLPVLAQEDAFDAFPSLESIEQQPLPPIGEGAPEGEFQPDPAQQDPAQQDPAQQDPAQQDPAQQGQSDVPVQPTAPERIKNPVAEFTGVDKITGRIITFDVYIDETVQFGALQVTPRVCYSRPITEEPKTDSFVEVDEITLDRKIRRIFTGWMFAESPGLNAVEHAVYDVWLKSCKQSSDVPAPTATN